MCYQLDLNGEMVTDSHYLRQAENIAERFFSSFAKRLGKKKDQILCLNHRIYGSSTAPLLVTPLVCSQSLFRAADLIRINQHHASRS